MKIFKLALLLVVFITFPGFLSAESDERLWISFGGYTGNFPKYLMTIDVLGNIEVPPFRVSELGHYRVASITALSLNGFNALNFWYASTGHNGQIFRVVIDKQSLKSLKWVKTSLKGMLMGPGLFSPLDVTNQKQNNFISFPIATVDGMRVAAFSLDEFGKNTGKKWFITPSFSPECGTNTLRCKGGASSDSHFAYWIDFSTARRTDLFVQPLGSLGRPILKPVLIDSLFSSGHTLNTITSADVTNTLKGNSRFVVYIKQPETRRGSLLLQKIDAYSGNKIGLSIALLKATFFKSVKVDPKGRFILFIVDDPVIGTGLAYLALDAAGSASGRPKILTGLALAGLDLLREQLPSFLTRR